MFLGADVRLRRGGPGDVADGERRLVPELHVRPGDRLATKTDGTGTTTYGYDAAGRFGGWATRMERAFEQDHDAMDRVSAVRARAPSAPATAFETTYTHDAAGNLETVTDPFGRTTTYTYDAANRLVEILRPNGVRTTTTYDARDRVASIVHADGSGTVLASVAYVRAASGEPTRITREDGSYVRIEYDGALRVARERYSTRATCWRRRSRTRTTWTATARAGRRAGARRRTCTTAARG